jgi:hypothetical protein
MTLESAATWLENLALPTAIRESALLFPVTETAHVLALALVVGSIASVDLRLLGLTQKQVSAAEVTDKALPWTWIAFLVAVITGGLLFSSSAVKYTGNPVFGVKMLFLMAAGINMAVFNMGAMKRVASWDRKQTPLAAKVAGALSLMFWIGVVVAGRWVGFSDVTAPS